MGAPLRGEGAESGSEADALCEMTSDCDLDDEIDPLHDDVDTELKALKQNLIASGSST